ncbi:hypothetical protein RYR30_002248 [Flavobacterium psychrophilum]|uniref:hypothetical protein n=1 Tax=Flavobacterium psychrophilum TaxID=96345 RepID=UPI000B7C1665|nr:hypothetical protein [Flavobacterium psychrophilum]EKT3963849.1 hypothetical protein [Flavobacterium psychrophilum]EKT4500980.1 hypothetical protein [Flavobacterium psychrophilum]EKT4508350.1 hypothetical protein [Flavobacterium psychrophilum]EKT4545543.1 hypothetical protein [Flavobacterium psychrophilum]EKT4550371.1 hypothetical protein [Flavobacterium psychrophilum]
MKLSQKALKEIKTNRVIGALIIATDKSYPTIKRWIESENNKITDSRLCMNLIMELTGLTIEDIIEPQLKKKSLPNT